MEQVPDAHEQAGLALPHLRLEAGEAARWTGRTDRAVALLQESLTDTGPRLAGAGRLPACPARRVSERGHDNKAALPRMRRRLD